MTPPLYEVPASRVGEAQLGNLQTSSQTDNLMNVHALCAFGRYHLDCERRLLTRDGKSVALHEKALQILIVLVRHCGEVVSKDELMKSVWPDAFVEEANLSQNIFVLRKALGERPKENRYIATIPGRGYSFVAHVQDLNVCVEGVKHTAVHVPLDSSTVSPANMGFSLEKPSPKPRNILRPALILVSLAVAAAALSFSIGILQFRWLARYYNNRGVVLQQKGDLAGATKDYRLSLWLSRAYAPAHYNLGDAYEEIPDYAKAEEQYQLALDSDPTFYPAYNNLSRLYILRKRDFGAAMRLLDHALSFKPKDESILFALYKNYGWANLESGQVGRAEWNLQNALKMDVKRGSAHCLLGEVFERQGKRDNAQTEWESCLRYSDSGDVEPEWKNSAQEKLRERERVMGG